MRRYAEGFDAAHLGEHGVASPLALWVLLALAARAASGPHRRRLEDALGTDAADAARRAGELLASPHPAVAAAVAVWDRAALCDQERFGAWAADLPPAVERGPVPDQAGADAWAARSTAGLVDAFPATLDPLVAVVLVSAFATSIRWAQPFDEADPAELGGAFGARARSALRVPVTGGHAVMLAETDAAGTVGVHAARSGEGLEIVSVIAAPEVATARVHRAAGEVAVLLAGGDGGARPRTLFDVAVGNGHAWTVEERWEEGSVTESCTALLTPWRASSFHDVGGDAGVEDVFATLDGFLIPAARPGTFQAVQAAGASYGREGFEGAAVTVLRARPAGRPRRVRTRHATIRFNRPYAVVAVARTTAPEMERGWAERTVAPACWDGVPVFSAWVERPGG